MSVDMEAMEVLADRRGLERCPELLTVVQSQFRVFELLEQHLQRPRYFIDQCFFPLPLEMKRSLLEQYYGFEDEVARELLDRRMSGRGRRDLDEICAQTGRPLAAIRRQFETFKRVQRRVEELPGDLEVNIQRKFLISRRLSARYAAVALLTRHRIDVGKKRVPAPAPVVLECAEALFFHLTLPARTIEFDYVLAREIRELRLSGILSDPIQVHEQLSRAIKSQQDLLRCLASDSYGLLQRLLDAILQLGSGLSQAKEVRDLFIDMTEALAQPLAHSGVLPDQSQSLFDALSDLLPESGSWRRLLTALKISIPILVSSAQGPGPS